ncbi:MAG: SBBP repeat-containing protein, partial [Phaeodactylibacter sp.]|nr:SBBP repeat-containing protein [Phaeodactylibacter sp.]
FDTGSGITADAAGNVYATGFFQGAATFGSTTLTSAGNTNIDVFVVKYDAAGTVLWAQQGGGAGFDFGYAITADSAGNVYVTGMFQNAATFGNTLLTSMGNTDVFVVKYDAAGAILWAQQGGGAGDDRGYDITTDTAGGVCVTGSFQSTATFGSALLTGAGGVDAFVVKYDAAGTVLWSRQGGGAGDDLGDGIAIDPAGNVYVTGSFQATATFGGTTLTSAGSNDVFVVRYCASDADGDGICADVDCNDNDAIINYQPGSACDDSNPNTFGEVIQPDCNCRSDEGRTVRQSGGGGDDRGNAITTDAAGNVYATGIFDGTATFGSTTLTSVGSRDVFVVKYDAAGTVLWARQGGGNGFDPGLGIATDAAGNVYATGSFDDTATFGSTTITSAGSRDVFVVKYHADGTLLWIRRGGGAESDRGYAITTDVAGNVYVTGSIEGTATFGSITLTSAGNEDVFVVKYHADGTVLWAQKGGGAERDRGAGITTDVAGNVYATGSIEGTATFGNTTLTSAGSNDVFVVKYDAEGTVLWAQQNGGESDDFGAGITTDLAGNVYTTGFFKTVASFGNALLTSADHPSCDSADCQTYDVFVVKYDAAGTVLWAQRGGGAGDDFGKGITTDTADNIYITGFFEGTATFGSTPLTSAGSRDVFFVKYDAEGTMLSSRKDGGAQDDGGYGITANDAAGNVYVTGEFQGGATFSSILLASAGGTDVFVVQYCTNDADGDGVCANFDCDDNNPNIISFDIDGDGLCNDVECDDNDPNIVYQPGDACDDGNPHTIDESIQLDCSCAGTVIRQSGGGAGNDKGYAITTDTAGNVYVTGRFSVLSTFGDTSLTSAGNFDVFVVKYNAAGRLLWARKGGGPGNDRGYGITTDAAGNVYVTGWFEGMATFSSTQLTSAGGEDVFVVKYDAEGAMLWARKGGGADNDRGYAITTDAAGYLYATGFFEGDATFGNTPLTSTGSADVFVVKYDAAGTLLWAQQDGGDSTDFGYAITADADGHLYTTGFFENTATFGNTSLISAGGEDIFIAKYDIAGTLLWAQQGGGDSTDIGRSITTDVVGNVYVTGEFQGTAAFGSSVLISEGDFDVFVVKYDAAGAVLWAQQGGGAGMDNSRGIAIDAAGKLYVTGGFSATATFGNTRLASVGDEDVFVMKYDADGTVLWGQKEGGPGTDRGYAITTDDAAGSVYVTGEFQGAAAFGSGVLLSEGGFDIFVAKYCLGDADGDGVCGDLDCDDSNPNITAVDIDGDGLCSDVDCDDNDPNITAVDIDGDGLCNDLECNDNDPNIVYQPGDACDDGNPNTIGEVIQFDCSCAAAVNTQQSGGAGNDKGYAIATDAAGNVYVTGRFSVSSSFGNIQLTSAGSFDVFVVKYDAAGTLLWARRGGGDGNDRGYGITTDVDGNVYVTGWFEDTAIFGNTQLISTGGEDVFVVKYNAEGEVLWARKGGGALNDRGYAITTDAAGNVHITGTFEGAVAFGSTMFTSIGYGDVFVVKYDAEGTPLGGQQGSGAGIGFGYAIATDAAGNVFATGFFRGATTFGSTILTSMGEEDVFVVKYNPEGTLLWAQQGGSDSTDFGRSITTDGAGNVYVTGEFQGSAAFGSALLTSSGGADVFLIKYDPEGTLLWAQQGGGAGADNSRGITTDMAGNIYTTGGFSETAAFGSTLLTSAGSEDVFVMKYDAAGTLLWEQREGGAGIDRGYAITTDVSGNVYVTGEFQGTAAFGSGVLISEGDFDVFVAKYCFGDTDGDGVCGSLDCDDSNPDITTVDIDGDGFCNDVDCDDAEPAINPGAEEVLDSLDNNCNGMIDEGLAGASERQPIDWKLFPNPAGEKLTLQSGYSGKITIRLYNGTGSVSLERQLEMRIGKVVLNIRGIAPGFYFLEILSQHGKRLWIEKVLRY